jgi:uncharacterized protein (UPF0332 family)
MTGRGIDRAHQELEAARLLTQAGFGPQAVSRAYYAAFYAAEAVLLELGVTRSKHSVVIAAFIRHVLHDDSLDDKVGRLLRSLFDRRAQADYGVASVPPDEANRAVLDAEVVVAAIDVWIQRRT